MNINFLITTLGGGGAERVVCNLSNYLSEKDNNVTITVLRGDENSYRLDGKVSVNYLQKNYYRTKNTIKKRIQEIIYVYHYFRQLHKKDILVCFLELPVAYSLIFRYFIDCPLVICERNNPLFYSKIYQYLYKLLAKRADYCVCQTKIIADWYKPIISKDCELKIIHNSINKTILSAPFSTCSSRKIVTMARLTPQKNQKLLLDAFAEIHKKFPNYSLEIYGDGPLRNKLISYSESLNISNNVKFHGFTKDVVNALSDACMFVMSSNHEGMPNALAEAMAMGVPSISTDCGGGGARELISSGINGILIPCNDKEAMIRSMIKIISDYKIARGLSQKAKEIRYSHNPDKIHELWYDLFKNINSKNIQ